MASLDLWGLATRLWSRYRRPSDDLSVSDRLVQNLDLPSHTSSFVLALQVPQSPGSVVYVLVAHQLSERSASDAEKLIAAVHPKLVVAQIEANSLLDLLQEEADYEQVSYPLSISDVIKARFLDEARFEDAAGTTVVRAIFGTGFFGHVIAAKHAAALAKSTFLYLEDPFREQAASDSAKDKTSSSSEAAGSPNSGGSTENGIQAGNQLSSKGDASCQGHESAAHAASTIVQTPVTSQGTCSLSLETSSKSLKGTPGSAHGTGSSPSSSTHGAENLPGASRKQELDDRLQGSLQNSLTSVSVGTSSRACVGNPRRVLSGATLADFKGLSPSLSSSIALVKSESMLVDGEPAVENVETAAYVCPAFALPLDPWLTGLHELYKGLPGMRQALVVTRKMLTAIENGNDVSPGDLAEARSFRLAVEAIRLARNRDAKAPPKLRPTSGSGPNGLDFMELPYVEQCNVLLAQALQQQARKFGSVVAIMDAGCVAQIRKHWSTPVPSEFAAAVESFFIPLETDTHEGLHDIKLLDKQETTAVVVVGAGAAAAVGLASISHWAPVSTVVKILTFKIPTFVKLGLLSAKRSAAVMLTNVVAPAAKAVVPSVKAVAAPSKALFAPATKIGTSGKISSALKTFASAEKTKAAARSVVAAAERASLSAIRTGFYSVMRDRQGKSAGARPWLIFAGSVVAGSSVWFCGDGIERVIADLPSAAKLSRLGRGLENLGVASSRLQEFEALRDGKSGGVYTVQV